VVFDYEGDGHRTDARTFRSDIERRELFEAAGWRHVRVTADHVIVRPDAFTERVKGILRERGWRG
jgi:very-short-patch-repair endonuclease